MKAGLLLALPAEAQELHLKPGDKVCIEVVGRGGIASLRVSPNEGLLAALQTIAERRQGRRYLDASDTDRMLSAGRAGAMRARRSGELRLPNSNRY